MPTRLLLQQGHDITVLYANSNIAPRAEYEKRLRELERYAAAQGFTVMEGVYDSDAWEREVAPIGEALKDFSPALSSGEVSACFAEGPSRSSREASACSAEDSAQSSGAMKTCSAESDEASEAMALGTGARAQAPQSVAELLDDENRRERCRACYRMRLEEAARVAAEGGYDGLATTLAVSPYQFTDVIREELDRACALTGVVAHFEDYRSYYDEATRISRELGMYRQNYCGCRFSVVEGQATRAFIKQQRAQAKAAKAKARAAERAAAEESRQKRVAEKQAYATERARRRAILKQLRS